MRESVWWPWPERRSIDEFAAASKRSCSSGKPSILHIKVAPRRSHYRPDEYACWPASPDVRDFFSMTFFKIWAPSHLALIGNLKGVRT